MINDPHIPLKLLQYPLLNPEECITDLDPKNLVDFPSQERYPAPRGDHDGDTKCGCLYTSWRGSGRHLAPQGYYVGDKEFEGFLEDDRRDGEKITLETVWQPMWELKLSTPVVKEESKLTGGFDRVAEHSFQNWHRRHSDGQNYYGLPGSLHWPDRYHVWEIELTYQDDKILDAEGVLSFIIGEKSHLSVPLGSLFRRPSRPRSLVAPLPLPLYLPTCQNFRGFVRWWNIPDSWKYSDLGAIRYQLNGYHHRSIP